MGYTVLATRWRPRVFDDLAGQEIVVRTLHNALRTGRLANAFLFCGPRGVGKTSAARILAKALVCENRADDAANPCNECGPCRAIDDDSNVDYLEIDGASNNSVEDVRRLREQVAYKPSSGAYKLYVIDEVHMLSTSAFNALLKTLEEPPEHVKFILATTEPHKIPPTILSRCQRFDFRPIGPGVVTERMRPIAEAEGVRIEESALRLLAEAADGSMRDGMSLLDKVISAYGEEIDEEAVRESLGLVGREPLWALARAVLSGDAAATLQQAQAIHDLGYDLKLFGGQFMQTLRDLAVASALPDAEAIPGHESETTDGLRELLKALPEGTAETHLQRLFELFSRHQMELNRATNPRIVLEMMLLKLARAEPLERVENLVQRLGTLVKGGSSSSVPPVPQRGAGTAPPTGGGGAAATQSAEPAEGSDFFQWAKETKTPGRRRASDAAPIAMPREQAPASVEESAEEPVAPPVPEEIADDPSLEPGERWRRFLRYMEPHDARLVSYLVQGRFLALGEAEISIEIPQTSEFAKRLEDESNQQRMEWFCGAYFGQTRRLRVDRLHSEDGFKSDRQNLDAEEQRRLEEMLAQTREHPLVKRAMEVFDGEIVEFEIKKTESGGAERSPAQDAGETR